MLYTAITRARELLILVGDEDVVAHMTANDRQRLALLRPALASGPAGQRVRLHPPRLGCEKEELNMHA
ncbi:MAG: hypothetical protein ACLRNQ_22045 [Flavonifractor plautii]